jgi:aspartyl-tRNA synthetase
VTFKKKDFFLRLGNGTVQNFAENKGEITGISFQKVDDHEGIVQAIFDSNSVWLRQVFGLLRVQ